MSKAQMEGLLVFFFIGILGNRGGLGHKGDPPSCCINCDSWLGIDRMCKNLKCLNSCLTGKCLGQANCHSVDVD